MKNQFDLKVSESGTAAYLSLPTHPGEPGDWRMSKTIQLIDLIGSYEGPEVILDFGPDGQLDGIEVLIEDDDEE